MQNPTYGLKFRHARRQRQLTQVAVAKALGVSQSYIAQIEAGRSFPSPALLSRISELLGLAPPEDAGPPFQLREVAERFARTSSGWADSRVRMPVVGAPVPGDEERLIIDNEPHGSILAPPQLENVPGAQALYVRGRSMEPRYYPGELIYLNPSRPPNPGDFVVVVVREPHFAAPVAYVRQYLGEDPRRLRLATLNPKREASIERKALVSMATIVGAGLL